MTEFKKLTSLVETLRSDVTLLLAEPSIGAASSSLVNEATTTTAPSGACTDPELLHSIAVRIREAVADGCPRIRKLVQKARETDPNRQIYNESMCKKIEALFDAFCASLKELAPEFSVDNPESAAPAAEEDAQQVNPFEVLLDSDFNPEVIFEDSLALSVVDDVYSHHILKRAKEEEWQSRVAQGLTDVTAFEVQSRAFVVAEEKVARAELVECRRADKMRVIQLLEEREAAKLAAELQRRDTEQQLLLLKANAIKAVCDIPAFLQEAVPDAVARRRLAAHAHALIKALLSTPEDVNIRRLRNNNEHLICDYGHPCLLSGNSGDQGSCSCPGLVSAAEVLWFRMGYTIRYTKAPNRSLEVAKVEKKAKTMTLPCGRSLFDHKYTPLGFEDYSERFFELSEPNAMENPDAWMEWYSMMQEMVETLARTSLP